MAGKKPQQLLPGDQQAKGSLLRLNILQAPKKSKSERPHRPAEKTRSSRSSFADSARSSARSSMITPAAAVAAADSAVPPEGGLHTVPWVTAPRGEGKKSERLASKPLDIFTTHGVWVRPTVVGPFLDARSTTGLILPPREEEPGYISESAGNDVAQAILTFDFVDQINEEVLHRYLPEIDASVSRKRGLEHEFDRLATLLHEEEENKEAAEEEPLFSHALPAPNWKPPDDEDRCESSASLGPLEAASTTADGASTRRDDDACTTFTSPSPGPVMSSRTGSGGTPDLEALRGERLVGEPLAAAGRRTDDAVAPTSPALAASWPMPASETEALVAALRSGREALQREEGEGAAPDTTMRTAGLAGDSLTIEAEASAEVVGSANSASASRADWKPFFDAQLKLFFDEIVGASLTETESISTTSNNGPGLTGPGPPRPRLIPQHLDPGSPGAMQHAIYGPGASRVRRPGQHVGASAPAPPATEPAARRPLQPQSPSGSGRGSTLRRLLLSDQAGNVPCRPSSSRPHGRARVSGQAREQAKRRPASALGRGAAVAAVPTSPTSRWEGSTGPFRFSGGYPHDSEAGAARRSVPIEGVLAENGMLAASATPRRSLRSKNTHCPFSHEPVDGSTAATLRCGHCFALSFLSAARKAAQLCDGSRCSPSNALVCPLCGDRDVDRTQPAKDVKGWSQQLAVYSPAADAYLGELRKDYPVPLMLPGRESLFA